MLDNLFKKDVSPVGAPTPAVSDNTPSAISLSAEDIQAWQGKISAAASDDVALLQLVHEAPTVDLKLAAIDALSNETSFKQAMHDFREHDKRLYRAAKSRWEIANGTRVAGEAAAGVLSGARALLAQEVIPVNRVVELDQAWSAIQRDLLDAAVQAEFSELSSQLAARARAQGEHAQAMTRWHSATDGAMAALSASLPDIAQGNIPPVESEKLAVALLDLAHAAPDNADTRCLEKRDAANRLLALASSVVQRAAFLQALPASGIADEAHEKQMIEQWRAFPEMTEGALHTALATRFADWRNTSGEERQRDHDAQSAQERARRAEQNKQRLNAIQRDVEAAEAAQSGGHVADLTRLLNAIDQALKRGSVNAALTQRIEVLRAEQRRLQDWQRWGGRQGREQLVAEAQVLATQAGEKIAIKAHGDAIDKLRERWKELDKLGGASNQALWLAFDAALEAAYVPVAAHLEKLKQARTENLAAREQIVTSLVEAATKYFPAAPANVATPGTGKPDWRAVSHTLDEAQVAWRKLGPVEHTVPRKALQGDKAITTRYAAAVQALSAPLKSAYHEARTQREQLIAGAKELAASDVSARDVVDKVRKLQTQWQAVAKSMPLPRRDENALWQAFKTATDAIFTARDAARAASEAALNAKQQARIDIIERVAALAKGTTAAEIKRAMADADAEWRAAPEIARPQAAKLDARYRTARDAANTRVAELATHAAQARYDALLKAMALCDERESAGASSEELDARWNAIEHFPDAWKARLATRFRAAQGGPSNAPAAASVVKGGKSATETLPDILLNLEVACSIESPADFQAARQRLKILALKNAMEGRQTTTTTPADIERWLLAAAAHPHPDDTSRERLLKIVAAVRNRRLV